MKTAECLPFLYTFLVMLPLQREWGGFQESQPPNALFSSFCIQVHLYVVSFFFKAFLPQTQQNLFRPCIGIGVLISMSYIQCRKNRRIVYYVNYFKVIHALYQGSKNSAIKTFGTEHWLLFVQALHPPFNE